MSWTWIIAILAIRVIAQQSDKRVLIDTDIYGDVDDVGALAIANVLHNCGAADLQGVAVNTQSGYGGLAVSAINDFFGNGAIPIAALRPITDQIWTDTHLFNRGDYASKLAMNFPRSLLNVRDTPSPQELYSEVLQAAPNGSLTIVSIGFLNNLATLLDSSSASLLSSKVRELVIMGGAYPSGREYNFYEDVPSTTKVLQHWPRDVPITYIGFELGIDILSGGHLRSEASSDSPVLAAYEWYVGRCSTLRESWDPISVLYGILGLDGFSRLGLTCPFRYANTFGYNSISDADGTNTWVNDTNTTNQRWLELAEGVSNADVASILDRFYAHDPLGTSCPSLKSEQGRQTSSGLHWDPHFRHEL